MAQPSEAMSSANRPMTKDPEPYVLRLLVVDDHPDEFTLIESAIAELGLTVAMHTATTAPMAMAEISAVPAGERPQIALIDINMPLISGFSLAALLSREGMATHLISQQVDDPRRAQAEAVGAHGIYLKPQNLDGYARLLSGILASEGFPLPRRA